MAYILQLWSLRRWHRQGIVTNSPTSEMPWHTTITSDSESLLARSSPTISSSPDHRHGDQWEVLRDKLETVIDELKRSRERTRKYEKNLEVERNASAELEDEFLTLSKQYIEAVVSTCLWSL
jgi:hypothetical protein